LIKIEYVLRHRNQDCQELDVLFYFQDDLLTRKNQNQGTLYPSSETLQKKDT